MAETLTEIPVELKKLMGHLTKGPKLLSVLPKELQEPEFLARALDAGWIMVGVPAHSHEIAIGKSELAVERKSILKVSKEICWTALDQHWHKTIWELLQEDAENPEELKLWVKLGKKTK